MFAPCSFVVASASLFMEVHVAAYNAAFSSVRKLKLVGRRIVVETILFVFKRVIHSLD